MYYLSSIFCPYLLEQITETFLGNMPVDNIRNTYKAILVKLGNCLISLWE